MTTVLAGLERLKESYSSIVESERARLIRFATGMLLDIHEAEDAAQEGLARLYHAWDKVENPRGFLYRSVTNVCLDRLRQQKKKPPPQVPSKTSDSILAEEARLAVRSALAKLDPQKRAALLLCEARDFTYQEIAFHLDATVDQVTNWIFRAKVLLREILKPYIENGDKV